ncbi:NUDIX family hydrolase [Lactobacillus equicursoris DSM 19284 = JCM 14600 = CIP 110162]|uniref:NUDIX family hydrolase n=1 Tax=Lactobacillus equicursoris DSM 19284 = JCM 14600 = CIP 110162 TaxID=1293597 RepID=A0A0R1LVS5_9LACO|nr:NUDIX hydrolase [Lactobacillus equicursoris]KRK99787.1 NUDIX family hydrolase [Lactobacillus equicursoris DSM 19284 = JCM 14600 = CIP 110162]
MYKVVKKEVIKADRFTVIQEKVEKNGQIAPFSYVTIGKGISIIPFVDKKHVLLLKEYRHPVGSWQYEFPSGGIDEGEEPLQAAKRELLEETGYETQEIEPLGFTYPSFGSTNEQIFLFAGHVKKLTKPKREVLEEIKMEIVSVDQLEDLIINGKFAHGAGLAAWLNWKLRH